MKYTKISHYTDRSSRIDLVAIEAHFTHNQAR